MNSRSVGRCELLERRILMATAVEVFVKSDDNNIVVTGNNGMQNHLLVEFSADSSSIIVRFNGKEKHFSANNVGGVQLIGGDKADILQIENKPNQFTIQSTLIGGGGSDTLIGGDGHNLEIGGNGFDCLVGGNQDDTLVGGRGDDTILGGLATDVIFGGEGNDFINGGSQGTDITFGGDGNDTITGGGTGRNEIFGNAGDDSLIAQNEDTVYGGTGTDIIKGNTGSRGEIFHFEFPGLNKVLAIFSPDVSRFHAAGGARADTSPLL